MSQSVSVEVRDSVSPPVSDQFAITEASRRSKLENHTVDPVVRVMSLKSSSNRSAPPSHASVLAGDKDCSSQCAVRFPKILVGITSGDCCRWYFCLLHVSVGYCIVSSRLHALSPHWSKQFVSHSWKLGICNSFCPALILQAGFFMMLWELGPSEMSLRYTFLHYTI